MELPDVAAVVELATREAVSLRCRRSDLPAVADERSGSAVTALFAVVLHDLCVDGFEAAHTIEELTDLHALGYGHLLGSRPDPLLALATKPERKVGQHAIPILLQSLGEEAGVALDLPARNVDQPCEYLWVANGADPRAIEQGFDERTLGSL